VLNAGIADREGGRHREAIAWFETLLGSGVCDRDPSPNLMEVYRNYRHRACLEISACYEALGETASALRYAVLARDSYPYQSWCVTCQRSAAKEVAERIGRLEGRAGKGDGAVKPAE
jgi:hypothetical protein